MRVLNHQVLDESCGGDRDFACELFGDLSQRAQTLSRALHEALGAANSEGIRKAAHELKGSSLTLGAEAVADLCLRLETLGAEKQLGEVSTRLQELDEELVRLWRYLREQGLYPAST